MDNLEFEQLSLEDKIVELFLKGYTYAGIQRRLGNPSKAYIKSILQERVPEEYKDLSDTKLMNKKRE